MIVQKGDILKRNGIEYEVICADDEYFVIGQRDGTLTYFENAEIYTNSETINTLQELNFEKII